MIKSITNICFIQCTRKKNVSVEIHCQMSDWSYHYRGFTVVTSRIVTVNPSTQWAALCFLNNRWHLPYRCTWSIHRVLMDSELQIYFCRFAVLCLLFSFLCSFVSAVSVFHGLSLSLDYILLIFARVVVSLITLHPFFIF